MLVIIQRPINIIIFFGFFFSSCQKEDSVAPTIFISSPLINESFQIPTTINISGYTQDNINIDRVEIDLVADNSTTIIQKIDFDVDSVFFEFDIQFSLIDRLLASGTYYINIKSFDDKQNMSSKYVPLYLYEVPKVLMAEFFITSSNNITDLYELDSSGNAHLSYQLSGNYKSSIGNSRHQYLFIGTDVSGSSISPPLFNNLWDLSSSISFYNFFSSSSKSNNGDQIHFSFSDGRIFTCNKDGNVINAIYSDNQENFGKYYVDNDLVLVESTTSFSQNQLVVYFRQSGIEKQRGNINGNLVEIIPLDNQEYILASNLSNNALLSIYFENTNTIYDEFEIQNSEIYDAYKVNNNILIASSSGLLEYNISTKMLNTINSQLLCEKIIEDEINQNIYFICGKELWNYNSGNNLIQVRSFSDSLKNYIFFYNK